MRLMPLYESVNNKNQQLQTSCHFFFSKFLQKIIMHISLKVLLNFCSGKILLPCQFGFVKHLHTFIAPIEMQQAYMSPCIKLCSRKIWKMTSCLACLHERLLGTAQYKYQAYGYRPICQRSNLLADMFYFWNFGLLIKAQYARVKRLPYKIYLFILFIDEEQCS